MYKRIGYLGKMISFFTASSLLITILLGREVTKFFTPVSLVFIIFTSMFIFILYYFVNKKFKTNLLGRNIYEFNSFSYKFLIVKIFDVLFQQILVVLLVYIGKTYGGNNFFLLSAILFVLLHFAIFPFNKIRISLFFLVLSIPASIIFISIYSSMGSLSFGIAYLIHLSFYLILGILDLNGKVTKLIGT